MFIDRQSENGRWRPVLVCDVCGGDIEQADQGMVKLYYNYDGRKSIRICHKNINGKYGCDMYESDGWYELEAYLYRLCYNLGMDFEEAKTTAEIMAQLP